jgi:hypothetical protein
LACFCCHRCFRCRRWLLLLLLLLPLLVLRLCTRCVVRLSFALDCFKSVVQTLPDSFEAWGNLGAVHGELGNLSEAMGAMEEAAKIRYA